MFCALEDLKTESDVEQKFLWQLLTSPDPRGLGYSAADILTKHSIRRLEIGKGTSQKLYYPDYMVILAGLPTLVLEAKTRGEDVLAGLEVVSPVVWKKEMAHSSGRQEPAAWKAATGGMRHGEDYQEGAGQ